MRLLAGRNFTWDDDSAHPKVALINQTCARMLYGNTPVVGRHFLGGDKTPYLIVGVVEDGKYESLTEDPTPAMYYPIAQDIESEMTIVVRSELPPAEIAGAVDRVMKGIDASIPVKIQTWQQMLGLVLFPARVATAALGVMGLLAAMLAVTGIFGMAAYAVSKRLRELGIRVALGAQRSQVMRSALAKPFVLLLSGSVAGVVLGVLASKLLASLVYQATPRDPIVLAGAIVTMLFVGLVATWAPARRALSVNPAQLLRQD
jgi:ABC-type antimicrobial peptide transport system permease subunit